MTGDSRIEVSRNERKRLIWKSPREARKILPSFPCLAVSVLVETVPLGTRFLSAQALRRGLEKKKWGIKNMMLLCCVWSVCAPSLGLSDSFATPWTAARQALLSMEFSRQEYWSGLPFPSPENLPDPGIEPACLASPAVAGVFFTTSDTWEAPWCC